MVSINYTARGPWIFLARAFRPVNDAKVRQYVCNTASSVGNVVHANRCAPSPGFAGCVVFCVSTQLTYLRRMFRIELCYAIVIIGLRGTSPPSSPVYGHNCFNHAGGHICMCVGGAD